VVEDELVLGAALEPRVYGLDVGQNGGVCRARVPEAERPLDGGEVVVFDGDTARHEAGFRVGVDEGVL
jgi:hypothetical protein